LSGSVVRKKIISVKVMVTEITGSRSRLRENNKKNRRKKYGEAVPPVVFMIRRVVRVKTTDSSNRDFAELVYASIFLLKNNRTNRPAKISYS
jgi:hypothetical protein